jgi:hypothetical protein
MRFDWFSFVFGAIAGMVIWSGGQRFVNRLRWKKISTSLEQYARDLEDPKRSPHKP